MPPIEEVPSLLQELISFRLSPRLRVRCLQLHAEAAAMMTVALLAPTGVTPPTDQGVTLSEIEVGIDRGLLRDLLTNQCEADVLVDLIRAGGISHETDCITIVIADGE